MRRRRIIVRKPDNSTIASALGISFTKIKRNIEVHCSPAPKPSRAGMESSSKVISLFASVETTGCMNTGCKIKYYMGNASWMTHLTSDPPRLLDPRIRF